MYKERIKVRNTKEFNKVVQEHRADGWQIITFWKLYAEMERGNEMIVIEH